MPVLGALLKESVQLLGVGCLLYRSPLNKHHALLVLLDLQLVLKGRHSNYNTVENPSDVAPSEKWKV